MIKFKYTIPLIVLIIGIALGLFARPTINTGRNLTCNLECKAQLLYKNPVFFNVQKDISAIKKDFSEKVFLDPLKYDLHGSGIDLLVISETGEFMLTSDIANLALLVRPDFKEGRLTWHCKFFSAESEIPAERPCSY